MEEASPINSDTTAISPLSSDVTVSPASSDITLNGDVTESDATSSVKKKWMKSYTLPPCKVCGANGTGFHYGVNTCEPCKVFFRRSLSKHPEYVCRQDARCNIGEGRRTMCAYCRYQKCLHVGMSLEGIRNGRYTLTKKNHDIKEVKQMKTQQALVVRLTREEAYRPSVEKLVVTLLGTRNKYSDLLNHYELKHMELTISYMEKYDIEKNLLDDMLHLKKGDARVEVWDNMFEVGNQRIKVALKFAKGIPGFRELEIKDQVTLFQHAFGEMYMACVVSFWINEGSTLLDSLNYNELCGKDLAHATHRFTTTMKKIPLTEEEFALLAAMVLFQSDRCSLKDPERVDCLQHQMATALQWLLQRNHPDDKHLFHRVISLLLSWRSLEDHMYRFIKDMMALEDNGVITVPQLMKESLPPSALEQGTVTM